MKKILVLLIGLVAVVSSLMAQENEKNKRLTRDEKKELKAQEQAAAIELTTQIISDTAYVLEADFLNNKKGQRIPVSSMINFILVNGDKAMFQFGTAMSAGYNGVGGLTLEGNVNSYEVSKRKRGGSYFIRFAIATTLGSMDITLDIMATGTAGATISTIKGDRLYYSGNIVSISTSRIYKGMSL